MKKNFLFHRGQEFTERDLLVLDYDRTAHLDSTAMTRRHADAAVVGVNSRDGSSRPPPRRRQRLSYDGSLSFESSRQ